MTTYYTYRKNVRLKPGQHVAFKRRKGYYAAGRPKWLPILIRSRLVTVEEAAARLGIHEVGGNNHGPWVKRFLAAVGLPEGYPWCAAFQSYELEQTVGHKMPIESASVEHFYDYGRDHGWVVKRPLRGDLACYDFNGDGRFDDHIELVDKVLRLGPLYTLRVIGGNTSSGVAGSQADGDGVWLRRRVIARGRVAFVRIPGNV